MTDKSEDKFFDKCWRSICKVMCFDEEDEIRLEEYVKDLRDKAWKYEELSK